MPCLGVVPDAHQVTNVLGGAARRPLTGLVLEDVAVVQSSGEFEQEFAMLEDGEQAVASVPPLVRSSSESEEDFALPEDGEKVVAPVPRPRAAAETRSAGVSVEQHASANRNPHLYNITNREYELSPNAIIVSTNKDAHMVFQNIAISRFE